MRIAFINVGYGEAILIEEEYEGQSFKLLIDGGSNFDEEYADSSTGRIRLKEYLKKTGIDRIDAIIISHIHEDHVSGLLPIVKELHPKELWMGLPAGLYKAFDSVPDFKVENADRNKFVKALRAWKEICELTEETGVIRTLSEGDKLSPISGLEITVLGPSERKEAELAEKIKELMHSYNEQTFSEELEKLDVSMNNYSLIIRIDCKGRKILLPGDTNSLGYENIPKEELNADIFKVGHHGQRDGISALLIDEISPNIIVCCASSDRRYGSASEELKNIASEKAVDLYYSDCPYVSGDEAAIPPHNALIFEINGTDDIKAYYTNLKED